MVLEQAAKLALERRFGLPDGAKLPPDWCLLQPVDAKLALERRFGRPDGTKLPWIGVLGALNKKEQRLNGQDRKKNFSASSAIRGRDRIFISIYLSIDLSNLIQSNLSKKDISISIRSIDLDLWI